MMSRLALLAILVPACLVGCGTISERGKGKVDVTCNGWSEDMDSCLSAARFYCAARKPIVMHDYSQDQRPERRLLFRCE
jgi:hypothetical protein